MPTRVVSLLLFAFAAFVPLTLTRATSVVPPSFAELVAEADAIYRGEVTAIEARRVTAPDGGNVIKTFVTFALQRTLKGAERTDITLEFLGGKVGDESLVVTGMPKFSIGQREFVFVQKNGVQFCPLVAVMHGRYKILRNEAGARDYIARDNGAPLTDLAEVELPMHTVSMLPEPVRAASAAAALSRALTPAAFEAGILSEVQKLTPRARLN